MRLLKQLIGSLIFIPLLSFAAMEASYSPVSPVCYRAFKTIVTSLPDIAANYGYGISNLETPAGNPSTYTFTVDYTPTGVGLGDYALTQKYSNNTLNLKLVTFPNTFPEDKADQLWEVIGQLLMACPIVEQK